VNVPGFTRIIFNPSISSLSGNPVSAPKVEVKAIEVIARSRDISLALTLLSLNFLTYLRKSLFWALGKYFS
jgi:hypothetical protein